MFRNLQVVLTALCALCLVLSFFPIWPGLVYISIVAGSYFALSKCWESIQERTINVDILMVLAAIGAIIVGHPDDAAALLFLFSLSSTLESLAMARTQSAIEALIRLRPSTALLITPEGDKEVQVEDLKVGDEVRVLAHQNLPADGVLLSDASINEATLTGESMPLGKKAGESVVAGTANLESTFTMRVTATVEDSALTKIVALVADAQENKASGERIAEWFGQRYTFFVLGAFFLSLFGRMVLGASWHEAIYPALILLVALSPCALVISTPATTLSALAYAARRGVLVRGGEFIEMAGRITAIALDKTGTLTEGKPVLQEVCVAPHKTDIICWHRGMGQNPEMVEAVRFAAALEAFSTHPIAVAIVEEAKELGLVVPEAADHQVDAGLGIRGTVDGIAAQIGQMKYFDELPGDFAEHVEEAQSRGLTAVLIHWGEKWAALGISDQVKANAETVIRGLGEAGVEHIAMLTGDNKVTAQAVASQVGIHHIHAALSPADKEKIVSDLVQHHKVAMVGDGVNDAPSLARSHLGIAMGGLGSDVALNAADVVLIQDRIDRIPELFKLGRKTNRIIKANLLFAAGMILVLSTLSFLWPYTMVHLFPGIKQMPLWLAVVGHEGSTVLVILNGLRLLRGP